MISSSIIGILIIVILCLMAVVLFLLLVYLVIRNNRVLDLREKMLNSISTDDDLYWEKMKVYDSMQDYDSMLHSYRSMQSYMKEFKLKIKLLENEHSQSTKKEVKS